MHQIRPVRPTRPIAAEPITKASSVSISSMLEAEPWRRRNWLMGSRKTARDYGECYRLHANKHCDARDCKGMYIKRNAADDNRPW